MPESFVCGARDARLFALLERTMSNKESARVRNEISYCYQQITNKELQCKWKILTRFIFSFPLSQNEKKKRKLISHWTKRVIDSSVYSARRILRNRSFFNAWNRDSQLDIGPDVHGHNISRKRRACPPFTATDNTRFN